jgi:hypothetical protein
MSRFTPVTSMLQNNLPDPIGVDQLLRKNRDAEQRNELARMAAETDQQNAQSYRAQLDAQTQARSQQATEQQAAQTRAWLENAVKTIRQNPALIPNLVQQGKARGVFTQETPDTITPEQVEAFSLEYGIAPPEQAAPLDVQNVGGFRVLMQGGKPLPGGVQAPQRVEPRRPNWQRVEYVDQKTGKPVVGVMDMDSANPQATLRPIGDAPRPASASNPQSLRKEFDSQDSVQNFKSAFTQYRRATTAPDTRAGDISVVYALGKIFDPNSVVREGEIALSQNAQPWLQKIAREANSQIKRAGRLDAQTRSEIVAAMRGQIDAMGEQYTMDRERFTQYAADMGFEPASVVGPNIYTPETPAAPTAPAAPARGQTIQHPSGAKVTILEP